MEDDYEDPMPFIPPSPKPTPTPAPGFFSSLLGGGDESDQIYRALLKEKGGNYGEAFNETELARQLAAQGKPTPSPTLRGVDPELLARVNRRAQSADVPATALLAAPYEGIKGAQQASGVPLLEGASAAGRVLGAPIATPNKTTSRASWNNVMASLGGAALRADDFINDKETRARAFLNSLF